MLMSASTDLSGFSKVICQCLHELSHLFLSASSARLISYLCYSEIEEIDVPSVL